MKLDDKTLILIHIQKTGGNTLRRVAERHYDRYAIWRVYKKHKPADFEDLPLNERSKLQLIVGHFKFGYHELLPQPATYIAFMRDPIKRVISNYNWTLSNSAHAYHQSVISQTSDLIGYVRSGIDPIVSNGMTKMLAGQGVPYGENPPKLLDCAKRNINSDFALVGLTEQFDKSLLLLSHKLGWKNIFYVRQNVTKTHTCTAKDISEEAKDVICQYNKLDVELYQYVLEKFERCVAQRRVFFSYELRLFQILNRLYALVYKPTRALYRAARG